MSQPWFSAETVIVRTWCIYTPRKYEGQSLQNRPCILVMRCPEQEIVNLLGGKRAYSWEWDWDREHGMEVLSREG